jgi:hypothetical protein
MTCEFVKHITELERIYMSETRTVTFKDGQKQGMFENGLEKRLDKRKLKYNKWELCDLHRSLSVMAVNARTLL